MTSMTVATSVWWWMNSQREREMEMEKLEDFEIAERTFGKRRGKKCEKVCARLELRRGLTVDHVKTTKLTDGTR